jgi:hypothetical protein
VNDVAQLRPAELFVAGLVVDGEVVAEPLHHRVEGLDQVLRGQFGRFSAACMAL